MDFESVLEGGCFLDSEILAFETGGAGLFSRSAGNGDKRGGICTGFSDLGVAIGFFEAVVFGCGEACDFWGLAGE